MVNNDIIINNKYSSKILLKKHEKSNISLISQPKNYEIKEKAEEKEKQKEEEDEILDPDLMDNYELFSILFYIFISPFLFLL